VDNLVGEAQLAAGRLTLYLQPFEPEVLIRGVRSAGSLLAQRKGLELELEVEPDMPEWLMGDVNWLKQIVVNLAINAIKFTDNGRVSVHLQKVDEGHWAIKVSDTGMGIPRELQEVIFEPFKQAEGLGAERRGGSGLGLSIVRNLVGLMQGKIELESEAGVGATFRVTLPLEPMERMT
jgi:signal transduction histidine kinase